MIITKPHSYKGPDLLDQVCQFFLKLDHFEILCHCAPYSDTKIENDPEQLLGSIFWHLP